MKVKSESEVVQSCPTLSDPMDCSLPGSSVYGIFQARVLEWGAIASSERHIYVDPNLPIHPILSSHLGIHIFVLYVCVSILVLQIGSPVPFFYIPLVCINVWYLLFSF